MGGMDYGRINFTFGRTVGFLLNCNECSDRADCQKITHDGKKIDIDGCLSLKKLQGSLASENHKELALNLPRPKTFGIVVQEDPASGIDRINILNTQVPLQIDIVSPCNLCAGKELCPNRAAHDVPRIFDSKAGCEKLGAFLGFMELVRANVRKSSGNVH